MATQLEKRSAELMLKKLRTKLDSLFQDQEQNKPVDNSQQAIPKFEGGGPVLGMDYLDNLNYDLPMDPTIQNDYIQNANNNINWSNNPILQRSQDAIVGDSFAGNELKYADSNQLKSAYNESVQNSNQGNNEIGNFSKYASIAGQLAPIAYNLIQGSKKEDQLNPNKYQNPYIGKINSLMSDRRYNVNPGLASNTAAFNTYTSNLRNSGAMTPGQYRNNLLSAQNQRMMANASQYTNKQNQDNQYMGEEANSLLNIGNQVAATNLNVKNINDQNSASRRNFLASGFGNISQFAQMQQLMKNQKLSDVERMEILKVLNARSPQYFQQTFQNRGYNS